MSRLRPELNAWDVPEFLPGAQCNANPAERDEFETRCKEVWRAEQEVENEWRKEENKSRATRLAQNIETLIEMFPQLEASLIQNMYADCMDMDVVVAKLIALTSSCSVSSSSEEKNPAVSECRPTTPPPAKELFNTERDFPVLTTGEGWQVFSVKAVEEEMKGEEHAWKDCAERAKDLPSPPKPPGDAHYSAKKKKVTKKEETFISEKEEEGMGDYELHMRTGARRAQRMNKRGRGRDPNLYESGVVENAGESIDDIEREFVAVEEPELAAE